MDPALLIAALLGALAGVLASMLPGIHVNLLATATILALPHGGAPIATFLVAALASSPFGLALSATLIGGASDDTALAGQPAVALAREGRLREAVALQCWGALLGILLALPLALLARALLVPVAPRLSAIMPWILLGIVIALVVSETRRLPVHRAWLVVPWPASRRRIEGTPGLLDPHGLLTPGDTHANAERIWVEGPLSRSAGRAAALGILLLSGVLGMAAFRLGATSPLGWPSSPLLPLLAGLFALPALIATLRTRARPPRARLRAPRERLGPLTRAAFPGAAASALLGLAPGVSASHAALLAPRAGTPESTLVRLAAVNGGGVVFTLLAWHALSKARSGALVAAGQLAAPAPWPQWLPSSDILDEAALVVLAALVGMLLAQRGAAALARIPPQPLALGGLALLLCAVAALNGALGLWILATAGLVGALPGRIGVRRSHAMGVILVPALAWVLDVM